MSTQPWSGWWWPMGSTPLPMAEGPLKKFDQYIKQKANQEVGGQAWEQVQHFEQGCGWCGHCHGWSAASVLEPEPIVPITMGPTTFDIGDLKGLLTEVHCTDTLDLWKGERGGGASGTDKLLAHEFHQVLLDWVQKGIPVVMDLTMSPSVWNYPVFDCQMTQTPPGLDGKIHVTCTISYSSDGVPKDFVGSQVESKHFTYWLLGSFNQPLAGDWEGASVNDHPGFIWHPEFVDTSAADANPAIGYYDPYIVELIQKIKDTHQQGGGGIQPLGGLYAHIITALAERGGTHAVETGPQSLASRRALINALRVRPRTLAVHIEPLREETPVRREGEAPLEIRDPAAYRIEPPEWKIGTWWEIQVRQSLTMAVQPNAGLTLPTRMHFEVIAEQAIEGQPCYHVVVTYPDRPSHADFKYAEVWFGKDVRKPVAGTLHFGDKDIPMRYDFLMEMLKEIPIGAYTVGTRRLLQDFRSGRRERFEAFEVAWADHSLHLASRIAPFPLRIDKPRYTLQLLNWGERPSAALYV